MNRISILTAASLAWNPRVLKEAGALSQAGFEVTVHGASPDQAGLTIDEDLACRHGFKFVSVGLLSSGANGRSAPRWPRLRNRLGNEIFKHFGLCNHWQLGRYVPELLRCAREVRADYYIAHLEQALWVASKLSTLNSPTLNSQLVKIGVDMEDWYSEDLLPEARRRRPIHLLRTLEQKLLCDAAHSTCPSKAMSEAFAMEFGCRRPAVIYNTLAWTERARLDGMFKDRKDHRVPSVHWYSQTLGHGRGLEDLFAALPKVVHPMQIHLRGKPVAGFEAWLDRQVPPEWRSRVFVHALVSNDELLSRIAEHDIGFAGEMKYARSRDLTVTNKILHYLLGGLAVVASDTTGQLEVAALAGVAVRIYPSGNPQALADQLNRLLASPEELRPAKAAALVAAEKTFCWERQVPTLLAAVNQGISH